MEELLFRREFSVFQLFLGFIMIAIGTGVLFWGIREINQAKASINWPSVPGKIIASSVKMNYSSGGRSGNTSTLYYPEISYKFTVNDKVFNGSRIAYGNYVSKNKNYIYDIVSRYPKGEIVKVYYMPGTPEECLLKPGKKRQAWIMPTAGALLIAIGIITAIFYPRKLKRVSTTI